MEKGWIYSNFFGIIGCKNPYHTHACTFDLRSAVVVGIKCAKYDVKSDDWRC